MYVFCLSLQTLPPNSCVGHCQPVQLVHCGHALPLAAEPKFRRTLTDVKLCHDKQMSVYFNRGNAWCLGISDTGAHAVLCT